MIWICGSMPEWSDWSQYTAMFPSPEAYSSHTGFHSFFHLFSLRHAFSLPPNPILGWTSVTVSTDLGLSLKCHCWGLASKVVSVWHHLLESMQLSRTWPWNIFLYRSQSDSLPGRLLVLWNSMLLSILFQHTQDDIQKIQVLCRFYSPTLFSLQGHS